MNLKHHIIIIICISLAIFVAWNVMQSRTPAPVAPSTQDGTSKDHFIQVVRASYGLNCLNMQFNNGTQTDPFQNTDQQNQLAPDNALSALSTLCNGKEQCAVKIDPKVLGFDPSPQCVDKQLEVEYRCFSYDRPWVVNGRQGTAINIDCSNKN